MAEPARAPLAPEQDPPAPALSTPEQDPPAGTMPTWDPEERAVRRTGPPDGFTAGTLLVQNAERCPEFNCSPNSAVVNGSALGAIPLGGAPNINGFLIEPKLYPRDGSAPALGLDVLDGQIVGVDDKGEVAAMGDDLKGRWFRLIRRYPGTAETRGKIRIVEFTPKPLLGTRSPDADPRKPEAIAGYELKYEPESGAAGAVDLCRKAPLLWPTAVVQLAQKTGAGIWRSPQTFVSKVEAARRNMAEATRRKATEALRRLRKLPRKVIETVRSELPLDKPVTTIFVLKDEAYDEIDATIRPAPGTITLACPGTALSKMKLMGYDPQEQVHLTTLSQRQAVIKMLTGRYCDAATFTVDGHPLQWQNQSRWFRWQAAGVVEALWNENGAICLNWPRHSIYTREQVIGHCKNLPPCSNSVSWDNIPGGAELISGTPSQPPSPSANRRR